MSKFTRCLICNENLDLESGELSPYAKELSVHQSPCFLIYLRARHIMHDNASFGDMIDELAVSISVRTLGREDLYDAYLMHWTQLLLITFRNKEVMSVLDMLYTKAAEKFQKEKESS